MARACIVLVLVVKKQPIRLPTALDPALIVLLRFFLEARFKRSAEGLLNCPIEPAKMNEGYLHDCDSLIMFRKAHRLRINRADRTVRSDNSKLMRAGDDGRIQAAENPPAAPLGQDEVIVADGFAGADDPCHSESQFYRAACEAHPCVAGWLDSNVGDGRLVAPVKSRMDNFRFELSHGNDLCFGPFEIPCASVDLYLDFFVRIGLRNGLTSQIDFKNSKGVPVHKRANDFTQAYQEEDEGSSPTQCLSNC